MYSWNINFHFKKIPDFDFTYSSNVDAIITMIITTATMTHAEGEPLARAKNFFRMKK